MEQVERAGRNRAKSRGDKRRAGRRIANRLSIPGFAAGSAAGEQACCARALAGKALAARPFGIDTQGPPDFHAIAVLQGRAGRAGAAPDAVGQRGARVFRQPLQQAAGLHGLRQGGVRGQLQAGQLHLARGAGPGDGDANEAAGAAA